MVTAALSATVEVFFAILSSRLTRYDKQLENRGKKNIYRLGLWFEAMHKAEDVVKSQLKSDTPEALEALKKALSRHFIANDMPPVKAVIKQIDAFLEHKTLPKLASSADRVVDRFLGINTGT